MSLFLGSMVKVSLVILAGLAGAALLRNRSAAVRHWVLAATILCAAVMPVLERFAPAWDFELSGTRSSASNATAGAGSVTTSEELTFNSRAASAAAPVGSTRRTDLLFSAWTIGAGISLLILLVGFGRLAWLATRARVITNGIWTVQAEQIGREYGLRRPVRLLETDHPSLLVTWGLFRPKVIIPRAAREWPEARVAVVLRHEFAHIRRGDWPIQIAGELLRSAYWFNPLLWIACVRLREESERACDDEVLTGGVEGQDYAAHLLDLVRALKAEAAPSVPASAVARSSDLERRIRAMLNARLVRTPTTRSIRFLTVAALLVVSVAIAAAQTGPVRLSGTILDTTGAPVPRVAVLLTNAQNEAKYEVTTDASGRYEFVPLPADTYKLQAAMPGFAKVQETVKLAGTAVRRDLSLALGTLEETISVAGERGEAGAKPSNGSQRVVGSSDRSGFERDLQACKSSVEGGRVRPPRKIKDVRPDYSSALQAAGVSGRVVMQATIGTDGRVSDVQVVQSAHADLDNAAIEAVRQWEFDGTLLNCQPMPVTMKVSVNFAMKQ